MKRFSILLLAALFACTAVCAQNEYNYQKRSLFDALPIRSNDIVFLGDSITDGCEWAELLDNRHVKNRGISADRSGWLLERIDSIIAGRPRKLFLMIGTNDLSVGVGPDEVAGNIRKLIVRFQKRSPQTKLYVQSILPVNAPISRNIGIITASIRRLSRPIASWRHCVGRKASSTSTFGRCWSTAKAISTAVIPTTACI